MAVLDTAAELNSLLDTWRREDQANLSPVSTLKGLVLPRSFIMLHNLVVLLETRPQQPFKLISILWCS